jgi:hypothetical protein
MTIKNHILKVVLILTLVVLASFKGNDEGRYKGILLGKKLSETPFGTYIKDSLPGNTMIMFISYGCSHCEDATKEITELKTKLDRIIVLGYGNATEKEAFNKNTGTNYKMYDYDFSTIRGELIHADKDFPPPPSAIWVSNNVIKEIFTKMPSARLFEKLKANR